MKFPHLSAPEALAPEQATSAAMAICDVMVVSDFRNYQCYLGVTAISSAAGDSAQAQKSLT